MLDFSTVDYVRSQNQMFRSVYDMSTIIGVLFCCLCALPVIVSSLADFGDGVDTICASLIFVLCGIGVMLLVNASTRKAGYTFLLNLNDSTTMAGNYAYNSEKSPVYKSKALRVINEVYWPTVTCLYFIISFATFAWYITWIIWIIAPIVRRILTICFSED